MRAYFAVGHDTIKKDGIAAQQLQALRVPGTASREAAAHRREKDI